MTTPILVTDEVNDEHYLVQCVEGCPIGGIDPGVKENLRVAAKYARGHASNTGHTVEIVDAREGAR